MPIDVRGPDGTIYRINTDDEEVARRTVRSHLARQRQEQEARARSGDLRIPGSTAGAVAGRAAQSLNPDHARQVADRAQRRQMLRTMAPAGLGYLAMPFANTIADPARRAEVARAAGRLARDVRQVPSLDADRLARETVSNVERQVRGVAERPLESAGAFLAAVPGVLWEATGVPSAQREERAQRDIDLARLRGDTVTQEQGARRANEATATLGMMLAAPAALGPSANVLRAGGVGVSASAPFALNRNSDQPLQERLPGALTEIGAVGVGSAAFQGLANRLASGAARRETAMNNIRGRAREFVEAQVRPFLAAVRGSSRGRGATDSIAAPVTMMLAENMVGGNVRRNLSGAIDDVARGVQRLSGRDGEPQTGVVAGEEIQGAIRRYSRGDPAQSPPPGAARDPMSVPTREWSLPQKAEALYDDTFEALDYDARQQQVGGVQGEVLSLASTQRVMDEIVGGISGTRSRERLTNPTLRTIVDEMSADLADGSLSFADMRRWRTAIREMKGDDQLRQGISRAELQRIYAALSDDIYRSADNIGGQAAQDLRKIDDWYARESQMIENQLSHYYGADGGESAFRRVFQDARKGGNLRRLQALSESLRDDQRRTLASSIINDLGAPPGGRAHLGQFDLDAFVTAYQNISPAARNVLFGGRGLGTLAGDLDNLARVAGYMKEVRGFTNWSRSGQAAGNLASMSAIATAGGAALAGNIVPAMGVALGFLGMRLTGELLTNPGFVRLLVQAPKAGQTVSGARAWMRRLAELAARDPAVAALLGAELSQPSEPQSRAPPRQQQQTSAPLTR